MNNNLGRLNLYILQEAVIDCSRKLWSLDNLQVIYYLSVEVNLLKDLINESWLRRKYEKTNKFIFGKKLS